MMKEIKVIKTSLKEKILAHASRDVMGHWGRIVLQFTFFGKSGAVKNFVNVELEVLRPQLGRIIKTFYDLNWGSETNDASPEILLVIPFRKGMPVNGAPYARVFEFCFYTDSSESFELFILEQLWKGENHVEEDIARAELKFSDWLAIDKKKEVKEKEK